MTKYRRKPAAAHSDDHLIRQFATTGLEQAMRQRSPWPRAMAFATSIVVPPPANGSTTMSPGSVNAHNRFSTTAGGMRPKYVLSVPLLANDHTSKC